jgi:WD40 repeat protein
VPLFNSLKKYNLFSKNLKEYSQAIDSLIISTKSPIFSAVFPNGHYSVVAEQSGNLKFVTEDGTTVRILSEHRAQVDQIKFSHSGQLMATSGRDNAIRIWNLSQINQRPLVISHNDAIVKLEFSPDDEQIMYMLAKSDVVRMQPLDMKIMASELCKVLTRNLTKDEWAFLRGS